LKKQWSLAKNITNKPGFWQVWANIFNAFGARNKAILCIQKGLLQDANNSNLHLLAVKIFLKQVFKAGTV